MLNCFKRSFVWVILILCNWEMRKEENSGRPQVIESPPLLSVNPLQKSKVVVTKKAPSWPKLSPNTSSSTSSRSLYLSSMYPLIFFFFFFFLFLSVAPDDECYQHQPFDCGPFKNLSHPFTSAELQPSYCGPPELRLTNCAPTDSPELTISPLTYQLLRLNQADETMTLARSDLWNNTCLLRNQFTNSTVLNSTILNYTTDNEDLTIYYGCFFNYEVMRILPSNLFNCSSINEEMSASFYMTNPTDPILNITTCYVGVRLKILQTAAFQLTINQASLREVLMEGFNVTYNSNCISQPCTKQPGIREFISKSVSFGLLDYFIFFTNEIIGKSEVSIYHVILHYGVRAF